jgi:hypothetical protein
MEPSIYKKRAMRQRAKNDKYYLPSLAGVLVRSQNVHPSILLAIHFLPSQLEFFYAICSTGND